MHLWYLLLLPLSYIIGSFSPAIRFGKFFYGIDVRDYGSKNPGANNVQRVLGWKPALLVFLFDTFKGVAVGAELRHQRLAVGVAVLAEHAATAQVFTQGDDVAVGFHGFGKRHGGGLGVAQGDGVHGFVHAHTPAPVVTMSW